MLRLVAATAAVLIMQFWVATAGTWSMAIDDLPFVFTTNYYDKLAEGFLGGSLGWREVPPVELSWLPDPFDPVARSPYGAASDTSYYAGRYFLYFGPVPAVALAVIRLIGGPGFPDSAVALFGAVAMTVGAAIAAGLLARRIAGLPAVPIVAAVGLGAPLTFALASPAIHEAATLAGQGLLVLGVAALIGGGRWLVLAGVCWALAIATRSSLLPAVAVLLVAAALRWRWSAGWAVVPLAIGGLLIGGYNQARFGSPVEFGHRYQITSYNLNREYDLFARPANVLPNVGEFILRPPAVLSSFPYLSWTPFPLWNVETCTAEPGAIIYGPIVGLIWLVPIALIVPLGLLARRADRFWFLVFALAALAALLPVLAQRWVTLRYLVDGLPLVVLAAGVAAARFRASRVAGWGIASVGVIVGILFGLSGAFGHVNRHNPALAAQLAPAPAATSRPVNAPGPANLRARFGDSVEVIGARFEPDAAAPGETVELVIWSRGQGTATVTLRDHRYAVVGELRFPLAGDLTETRQPFTLPRDPNRVTPPDLMQAEIRVSAPGPLPSGGALDPLPARDAAGNATDVFFGPLRVVRDGSWPPTGVVPVGSGGVARLDGVCAARVGARSAADPTPLALKVLLYWSATDRLGSDVPVTLRLDDNTGRVVATTTGDPGDGWYRTSLWRDGDRYIDEWDLPLPAALPAGSYSLRVVSRDLDRVVTTVVLPGS